jgi:stress-induced morphogen
MPTIPFNYQHMSEQVRQTLQKAFGPNTAIRTDEGEAGHVYVRIVSDRFDGLDDPDKQDLIWEALRREMHEEAQAVALVLAFGTDQI